MPLFGQRHLAKWLAGITTLLIAGVAIWWLTHPGGPLGGEGAQIPKPQPDIMIIGFFVTTHADGYVGDEFYSGVAVQNAGKATAEDCQIKWWPKGRQGPSTIEQSAQDIPPGSDMPFYLKDIRYDEPGAYAPEARVICKNAESPSFRGNTVLVKRRP